MRGAAIVEIVAIDRGNDHVRKAELAGSLRDMRWLGSVKRAGQAGLHVAKGARPRAGVAHDHEGGVSLLPALADIGASGLLAHRVQAVFAHDALGLQIARRDGRLDADPIGLAQRGLIWPMRLFGMAWSVWVNQIVDYHGHGGSGMRSFVS